MLPPHLSLTLAYLISGKCGLMLAVPPGYASGIFPPAGLAVSAMLIGGRRTLPACFAGAFLLNIWTGYSANHQLDLDGVAAALVIAIGSTVQAALGGWALRRAVGYPAPLDTARDLARFLVLTPICCLTSASLSLAGLVALGIVGLPDLVTSWVAWWTGDTLGVLVVLPLMLVLLGEPRTLWRARAWPVAMPMLLLFGLFVTIFVQVSLWEHEQSLLEFRILSQQAADQLRTRFGEQEVFLEQLQRSFSLPAPLSRPDFAILVQNLLQRFPTIQAVEWAPRVDASQAAAFVAAQQGELPGFAIREPGADGKPQLAGDRARYFPVTYVQPLRGNEPALGLDLLSTPNRQQAVAATVASGRVVATAPIRLVQEHGEQAGVLLMRAVSDGPNGAGVVLIVLRIGTFMEELLAPEKAMFGVRLIDLAAREVLYDSLPATGRTAAFRRAIDFGSRRYEIATAPTPAYLASHRAWQSWAVLAAGLLSTSLLGALLMLATGHTHRIKTLVDERTRELELANQRLRAEIEERLQTEAALRRVQRIEALGQLTGGIAHDFNNLLAVIMGNAEMARRRPADRVPQLLDNILRAGKRGANLTRQLLTFSRRQAIASCVLDPHVEIPRMAEMLKTSLRGDIELTLSMADDAWLVDVDPGELEIALLNLAVNARDAMPMGGQFDIDIRNAVIEAGAVAQSADLSGEVVVISLRDTGTGIAPDILPKVYEPFFTTKDVGRGTGLGLSQVYGFARQSGGHVVIETELGAGTRVALYLPRTRKPLLRSAQLREPADGAPSGSARILLVEDDAEVMQATAMMLSAMGYEVESVDRGRKALDWLAVGEHVDLVLSDIVMPDGMNGLELAREVRARCPDLPIVLMSGYSNRAGGLEASELVVLQKPVVFAELAAVVREQIGGQWLRCLRCWSPSTPILRNRPH